MEYTPAEKIKMGIPGNAYSRGGRWYSAPDGKGDYLGTYDAQKKKFISAAKEKKPAGKQPPQTATKVATQKKSQPARQISNIPKPTGKK